MVRAERSVFKPRIGRKPGLEPAMVSLDPVVRILLSLVNYGWQQLGDSRR